MLSYNIFYFVLLILQHSILKLNQMASPIAKPQKRLGEFLNEQQEPFMLELYLLERGYSNKWCLNEDSLKKRKRNVLLPFSKVLISIVNKLAFHSQSSTLQNRDNGQRKKHANCNVQFSSASSFTMFNLCSNVDVERTSISSHKDQTFKECNMRWQKQSCIEGRPDSLVKIPLGSVLNVNEDVEEMPKKMTEDSLLSVAIMNLFGLSMKKEDCTNVLQDYLPKPHVSQVLKSKRVTHKIKKLLLFDCVRDINITLPTKKERNQVCRQSMGPTEFEKLNCQGTREWGQNSENGLMSLLTIDYLDSVMEWSKFVPEVKDISFEITDAILDIMNNEIVSEMIGTLTPT
ncbi:unnamed protein product [Trifolium pratense]|uniref:Uncharacterized protein n=1 Tax=Trifolium pratense TaxID=57577 RepID=A0ACB0M3Z1_TRIPR|nr:unnamed protein product [Trifolium pratense]